MKTGWLNICRAIVHGACEWETLRLLGEDDRAAALVKMRPLAELQIKLWPERYEPRIGHYDGEGVRRAIQKAQEFFEEYGRPESDS